MASEGIKPQKAPAYTVLVLLVPFYCAKKYEFFSTKIKCYYYPQSEKHYAMNSSHR